MNDRDLADEMLRRISSGREVAEDEWPPVASRITHARRVAELTIEDVVRQTEFGKPAYQDLEAYNSEAFTAVSVRTLSRVAGTLGTTVRALLFGSDNDESISLSTVSDTVRCYVGDRDPDAASDEIGWNLSPLLSDPAALWDYPIMALRDIADALKIDWSKALPGK